MSALDKTGGKNEPPVFPVRRFSVSPRLEQAFRNADADEIFPETRGSVFPLDPNEPVLDADVPSPEQVREFVLAAFDALPDESAILPGEPE